MTDIVEQMAQAIAEAMNGGEFNDGKWYTDGQRQAWRNAVTPYAYEIEDLRIKVKILEMDYRNSIQESLILGDAWKEGLVEIEKLKEELASCNAAKTLGHE